VGLDEDQRNNNCFGSDSNSSSRFVGKKSCKIAFRWQLMIYGVNPEKFGKGKEYIERGKRISRNLREIKKEFFSRPENEQVNITLNLVVIRKLHEIQALIEHLLDPESFEKWLAVKFYSISILEQPSILMIRECVKDEVYRKRIFKITDEWLEKLE
jgi:hypothetical protein